MKSNQRLEYGRVAEVLAERGVVEPAALQEALQASTDGTGHFPEILVNANLVSDWELSAIVCDLYNLPFVTTAVAAPEEDAREGLDPDFLRRHGLVPLSRFGNILTVCMPAIVSAEVLGQLAKDTDLQIIPVVGTVRTNRRWLEEHLAEEPPSADDSWSSFFDEADEKVMLELDVEGGGDADAEAPTGLEALADPVATEEVGELEIVSEPGSAASLEEPPAPTPAATSPGSAAPDAGHPKVELPPVPQFGPPAPLPGGKAADESRSEA